MKWGTYPFAILLYGVEERDGGMWFEVNAQGTRPRQRDEVKLEV